jgi:hypothetical protein
LRRLAALAVTVISVAGCSGDDGASYLDDAPFRRAMLVASLVNPANG